MSLSAEDEAIRPIVAIRVRNRLTQVFELIYALLDSGCDRDYISSKLAKRLGLDLRRSELNLITVEEASVKMREFGDLIFESIDGSYRAEVNDVLCGDFPEENRDIPPARRDTTQFHHMSDIKFVDIGDAPVQAIIGVGHILTWAGKETRGGAKGQPIAINTDFGWTIAGLGGKKSSNQASMAKMSVQDEKLKEHMTKIFHTDFGTSKELEVGESLQARQAARQLEDTVRFDEEKGKYIAGLPWVNGRMAAVETLNHIDSRGMAIRRMKSLKNNLAKNPAKKAKAFEIAKGFVDDGIAIPIVDDPTASPSKTKPTWNLPAHIVEQKGKHRFCHDGRDIP